MGDFNSDGIGDIGIIFDDLSSGKTDASLYLSQPTVAVFPSAVNFGSEQVGQTSPPISVQISNIGNRALLVSGITVTGNFLEQNNCGTKLSIECDPLCHVIRNCEHSAQTAVPLTSRLRSVRPRICLTNKPYNGPTCHRSPFPSPTRYPT